MAGCFEFFSMRGIFTARKRIDLDQLWVFEFHHELPDFDLIAMFHEDLSDFAIGIEPDLLLFRWFKVLCVALTLKSAGPVREWRSRQDALPTASVLGSVRARISQDAWPSVFQRA